MEMWRIKTTPEIQSFISALHPEIRKKIREGMKVILSPPDAGKNLKDELDGLKSFRVGRLRIIYRPEKGNIIQLVAVGPRRIIYEETLKLVERDSTISRR